MRHRFHLSRGLAAWALSAVVASAAFAAPPSGPCDAPSTTIVIVRHADRAGTADSLSSAGMVRAQDLARVLATANITHIYHSDTHRTRDTAAPLVAALGLEPFEYPAKDVAVLIERILLDDAGKAVLVVGHINTVPAILTALGAPPMPDLCDAEHANLFVLRMGPGAVQVTRGRYGAADPPGASECRA